MTKDAQEAREARTARIKKLWDEGHHNALIAAIAGCSPETVKRTLLKLGLTPRDGRKLPPEEDAERLRLYEAGWIDREIGHTLHCCQETISQWRRKRGLPPNKKPRFPKKKAF